MRPDFNSIRAAHKRICSHIERTPVLTSSRLDATSGTSLFFKCENFQKIGAFKARGATNAVFSLDDATARRGVGHPRSLRRSATRGENGRHHQCRASHHLPSLKSGR